MEKRGMRGTSGGALRKFAGIGLFVAAAGLAAGCGGSEGASGGGSGGSDEPIKVGVVLPQSGVYAGLGEDITNGMELYFEENRQLAGRDVELVFEDDEADPQVGVQAARRLIESEQVDVLAGTVATPVAYGIIDLTARDQTPFVISNSTGNDATRRGAENVFRVSASSWQVSNPMGEYLVDEGVKSIVVSAADYAAGTEMAEGFKEGYTEAGGEVVEEVYPPLATSDYSSFLTRIRGAEADGEWSFYAGSDAVGFVQQYRQFDIDKPLYGPGYIVDGEALEAQGEDALGVVTALHYSADAESPTNEEFRSSYQEAYSEEASVYAVQGWDTAWLIGEALKANEGDTEPEALISAMEEVEFESPRGPMELDENHNPVQNIYIREVQEVDGGIDSVIVDTIEDVRDPGE
ncbi:ABC transporter substrate-binding protein [Rubrobacter indicoceani]|uniref:ABC transporter substrate-binding protein n=1 Tax=Rubrobacter indicoceani TaxID=2051957 RepID=UPI000E5A2834|nr:ABC transporter substrate-binding protein [Rubrobacter indicoceani]